MIKTLQIINVAIDELKPHPKNPRVHPTSAINKLARSISEFGWTNPILVSEDGYILAGHARLKAAKLAGLKEVPVIYLPLSGSRAEAYMIADNRLQDETDWDLPMLKDLLEDLDVGPTVPFTGFDEAEIERLMTQFYVPQEDDFDLEEELGKIEQPVSQPGDIWHLGPHRVMCGDSTKPEDMERLMGGHRADMVFTDPPYGVDYTGKTQKALKIAGDKAGAEVFRAAIQVMPVKAGAAFYVCCPAGNNFKFFLEAFESRCYQSQTIIWKKNSMVLGHGDYHYQHEPILYGWDKKGKHRFYGDRTQTTVWEIDRPTVSREHPTMKPVALVAKAINNSSRRGDIILDPFLGSGTTLIAAEQRERICYGVEVDPVYCEVAVKRYERYTGRKGQVIYGSS